MSSYTYRDLTFVKKVGNSKYVLLSCRDYPRFASECRCLAVFTLQSSPPSLFRPFVHVCVRVPPRHLTHACAQLERRCVGVSVGTRFARPPPGRGRGSSHSQFAATAALLACLAQLPSSLCRPSPLLLTTWIGRTGRTACPSVGRLVSSSSSSSIHAQRRRRRRSHFLPFLASSPQIIRTSFFSVSGLGLR